MLSSNNVIYGFQVAYDAKPDEHVIDSNERVRELLEKEEQAYKAKLFEEEKARRIAEMQESGVEIPEGMDPAEFLGLADSIMGGEEEAPEPDVDYVAEAQAEAERILAEAQAEAEEIINAAQLNAEALKNIARQDGEKEGYNEGTQRAALELQHAQQEMDSQLAEIKELYRQKELTMEHDIVDMCMGVFEKVFKAELSGRKDVVFHLLDHCVMGIDRSKQMQIKVNETNAEFIKTKRDVLQERVGSDVVFDIIADPLLNENQCIIETDGGIFDCGIDTELEELIREIRALS